MAIRVSLELRYVRCVVVLKLEGVKQLLQLAVSKGDAPFHQGVLQVADINPVLLIELQYVVQEGLLGLAPPCHDLDRHQRGVLQRVVSLWLTMTMSHHRPDHLLQIAFHQLLVHVFQTLHDIPYQSIYISGFMSPHILHHGRNIRPRCIHRPNGSPDDKVGKSESQALVAQVHHP
jgi:hypothetical protein